MSKNDTKDSSLSRRTMMKISGMTLVGVWSAQATTAKAAPQARPASQTSKPLFLAPEDAVDVAVHSRVENLFWCDVMMDHAELFAALMPGNDVSAQRTQAETFQRTFQTQYDRARTATFDHSNYAAFNHSTIELIKPFIEFKRRMSDAQASGKIHTFVFPSFFSHTAHEAERAVSRLETLADGNAVLNFKEVVEFWAASMSDDAELIAHFLDPDEQDLISEALDSSSLFKGLRQANQTRRLPGGEIVLATEELAEFETTLHDGVTNGRIKSILPANLADHMRRETLKFLDELKRGART